MSDKQLSTGKIVVFAFIALAWTNSAVGQIVEGLPSSSQACHAKRGTLDNFIPAEGATAAPKTVFKDKDSKEKKLDDYKGKSLIINFWATWCAPCVREMPQLDRLKALVSGNGIEVIAISEDRKGAPLVEKFYKINDLYNLEILTDEGGKLLRALGGRGLPTTVLLNREGSEFGSGHTPHSSKS